MRIYLIQHGEATSKDENPDRPLTDRGRGEVEMMARFLGPLRLRLGAVWHSGKTRARETAELLGGAFNPRLGVQPHDGLSPKDPVADVLDAIEAGDRDLDGDDVALVGHLPFMQRMSGLLLTGDPDAAPIAFRYGGVVCCEREGVDGPWQLRWLVRPDLLSG